MDAKSVSLNKKILMYLSGTFSSKMLNALVVPLYGLYVNPKDLGNFDYQQTLLTLLSPVFVCAIWEALLSFGLKNSENENKKKKIIGTSYYFTVILSILAFTLMLPYYLFTFDNYFTGFMYTIMIALAPMTTVVQYICRVLSENKCFVKSGIYASFVRIIILLIMLPILKIPTIGLPLAYIGQEVFIILYVHKKISLGKIMNRKDFSMTYLKSMLKFSTPLAFNLVFLWVITSYSRYFLKNNFGPSANGIYAFALQIANLVSMLGQVINMATLEDVLLIKEDDFSSKYRKQFNSIFNILLLLGALVLVFISMFYDFNIMEKNAYKLSLKYLPVVLLNTIIVLVASNMTNVFQRVGKTNNTLKTTLISAIVTIVTINVFAVLFGVPGILYAQLFSSIVLLYVRQREVKKLIDFRFSANSQIKLFLIYGVSWFISTLNDQILLKVIFMLLFSSVLALKNKEMILNNLKR